LPPLEILSLLATVISDQEEKEANWSLEMLMGLVNGSLFPSACSIRYSYTIWKIPDSPPDFERSCKKGKQGRAEERKRESGVMVRDLL